MHQIAIVPKYVSQRCIFKDTVDGREVPSADIFLYNKCVASGGRRGLACISMTLVDGHGSAIHSSNSSGGSKTAKISDEFFKASDLKSLKSDFIELTQVNEESEALTEEDLILQFRIWEQGRVDMEELVDKLQSIVQHSLWEVVTEYVLLPQDIITNSYNFPAGLQEDSSEKPFERLNEENQGIIEGLEEDNDDFKFKTDTLESELAEMKNEMIAVTDAKDKLIEEAHEKIASLESDDSSEEILVIKADNEAQRLKIIELTSQIEQSREQKISCDLHLTNINDALENVKLQLSEREAEIAQLEDVIKQKTEEEAKEKEAISQTVSYIIYSNSILFLTAGKYLSRDPRNHILQK